ncbi:DUF7576 family protein [Natronorubrum bangense]|uniref:TRASH domain-containing protein n=1 Tax=Natronorubrum bangense JCM 10635 TaxID=1227500 RepID=L9WEH7_9EURY|nr:hypothetical protein [Natronorubrum bangense]ELY47757.1 hypothetical protein C494_11165 [Natronorubrum bangense JCM 10635]
MVELTDEDPPECQQCGDSVASASEQRVVSTVEDGTAIHQYFCSDACLELWEA